MVLFTRDKIWYQWKCPSMGEWIKKMWCVCIYIDMYVLCLVAQSCLTLCDPVDCGLLGSSLHEISQARILPFPSPGDLPNAEIKPRSPALQVDSLPSERPGNIYIYIYICVYIYIYIYTHTHINMMDYYSAIEKHEILPLMTTWLDLDLEGIMLWEISMISLICRV